MFLFYIVSINHTNFYEVLYISVKKEVSLSLSLSLSLRFINNLYIFLHVFWDTGLMMVPE